jgi:hypothetical protein
MALIKGPWNWNRSSMGIANPNHLGSTLQMSNSLRNRSNQRLLLPNLFLYHSQNCVSQAEKLLLSSSQIVYYEKTPRSFSTY